MINNTYAKIQYVQMVLEYLYIEPRIPDHSWLPLQPSEHLSSSFLRMLASLPSWGQLKRYQRRSEMANLCPMLFYPPLDDSAKVVAQRDNYSRIVAQLNRVTYQDKDQVGYVSHEYIRQLLKDIEDIPTSPPLDMDTLSVVIDFGENLLSWVTHGSITKLEVPTLIDNLDTSPTMVPFEFTTEQMDAILELPPIVTLLDILKEGDHPALSDSILELESANYWILQ